MARSASQLDLIGKRHHLTVSTSRIFLTRRRYETRIHPAVQNSNEPVARSGIRRVWATNVVTRFGLQWGGHVRAAISASSRKYPRSFRALFAHGDDVRCNMNLTFASARYPHLAHDPLDLRSRHRPPCAGPRNPWIIPPWMFGFIVKFLLLNVKPWFALPERAGCHSAAQRLYMRLDAQTHRWCYGRTGPLEFESIA